MVFVWLIATLIRVAAGITARLLDWQDRRGRGAPWGPLVALHDLSRRWLHDLDRARDRRQTVRDVAIYRHGHDRRLIDH